MQRGQSRQRSGKPRHWQIDRAGALEIALVVIQAYSRLVGSYLPVGQDAVEESSTEFHRFGLNENVQIGF